MRLLPGSLFARAAWLHALTLLVFSCVVWQAVMWTIVVPGAERTADLIAQRAHLALEAEHSRQPLPEGVRVAAGEPRDGLRRADRSAFGTYLRRLRDELQRQLPANDVVIAQPRAPVLIWIRTRAGGSAWLVVTSRLASPAAPAAFTFVLLVSALLVLAVAAWSTRRLTRPLARLAGDAAGVADGGVIGDIDPRAAVEVRTLAVALQSMSRRLKQLNEERELLLAGISHDLRSPLARLRVALELLDPRDAELAHSMVLEIQEMDRMVGQFLSYVRAGYGEAIARAVPDQVVREALAAYVRDPRLQLELAAAGECDLHPGGLRHIVLNLVQNALDHGRPPVKLSTRFRGEDLVLTVHDTGAGIDAADWPEALRAFGRAGKVPDAGHSGLGLALVDRLVHATNATLHAAQVADGFEICVVFAQVHGRSTGTARPARPRSGSSPP